MPSASFFDMIDDGDQRERLDRRGDVAQRVELLVGGRERVGLADQRTQPTSSTSAANCVDRRGRRGSRGSPRACRACRRCGRARGPTSSAPRRRRRRPAARGRSRPCRRRRRSSACRPSAPAMRDRSITSPDSSHRVAQGVELGVVEAAEARPPSAAPRSGSRGSCRRRRRRRAQRISSAASAPPSRLRAMTSSGAHVSPRARIGAPGLAAAAAPRSPSHVRTVAPTSARSPSWRPPGCAPPPGVWRHQQRVLPRVVGRRGRRVAAVVGSEHQQVVGSQRRPRSGTARSNSRRLPWKPTGSLRWP